MAKRKGRAENTMSKRKRKDNIIFDKRVVST
jgi:hypothetical protein